MTAGANRWGDRAVDHVGPDLVALLDGWAATGHGSLARRLAHGLRLLVDSGVLPGGWRLPPERTLAGQLAVGRTTVTQALDELRVEGLLMSRQGSGTFVVGPAAPVPVGTRVAEHLSSGSGIDLAKGDAPDLSHLPPVSIEMWQLNAHVRRRRRERGRAAGDASGDRRAVLAGGTTGRPALPNPSGSMSPPAATRRASCSSPPSPRGAARWPSPNSATPGSSTSATAVRCVRLRCDSTAPGWSRSRSTPCSVVTDRQRCTSKPARKSRPDRRRRCHGCAPWRPSSTTIV